MRFTVILSPRFSSKVPAADGPPEIQEESPRVPLPPPIIPETEDSSPVSETSSGYISTSISTATLSDVYTLSWDLPPLPSRRIDSLEAEEESSLAEPPPLPVQRSQVRESLLVSNQAAEEQDEPGLPQPASRPWDPAAQPGTREGPRHRPEALSAQEDETDQAGSQQAAGAQELDPPSPCSGGLEAPPQTEPRRGQARRSGAAGPDGPRDRPLSPACSGAERLHLTAAATEAPPEAPNRAAPGPVGASRFHIQKVKSSDLKSFQPILGTDEAAAPQADRPSGLAAPLETLEIISDSEGDAAAALPDWLKEGELVTVGGSKSGTVRYVGPAHFAEGTWVGVELEGPAGG